MSKKSEAFEKEMRSNGMFDVGSEAMARCPDTGGYLGPDTNAMWAGFCLAWRLLHQDGWKLVPITPTHDMQRAGCRVPLNKSARHNLIYDAMIAAAPKL